MEHWSIPNLEEYSGLSERNMDIVVFLEYNKGNIDRDKFLHNVEYGSLDGYSV